MGMLALSACALGFVLVVTGKLTLDTGVGRRTGTLGPQVIRIAAPRDAVFDLIGVPYRAKNPPRSLRDKVEVLDRGVDLVLAAHRTRVGALTAVTVETVTFDHPGQIAFRLLRGPVPAVTERFLLREIDGGRATELTYEGEMGTDGWALGAMWGHVVARQWERAVERTLASLKAVAEEAETRRASRGR